MDFVQRFWRKDKKILALHTFIQNFRARESNAFIRESFVLIREKYKKKFHYENETNGLSLENTNRWYLLKYPIFQVQIVSEHTLRYTESCVWISLKMNMFFWYFITTPGFQFQNSRPSPSFTTHFTNTRRKFVTGVDLSRYIGAESNPDPPNATWMCFKINRVIEKKSIFKY